MSGAVSGLRILSVEDEPLNRALLRATFARAPDDRLRDAMLLEAATLADAREMLNEGTFDIILPDGDGFDLARELSVLPDRSRPLVVALTADAIPETRQAASDAGCVALLTKPFRLAELAEIVGRLLDSRLPPPAPDMRT
jgi:CheY-like chemotaxis protein